MMKRSKNAWWAGGAGALCVAFAGAVAGGGVIGPDVIVGDLNGTALWGSLTVDGEVISAYSIGTTSCNVGDEIAQWVASTPGHPVIAQNMYRINSDGVLEHIGQSWLKHSFAALSGSLCLPCQPGGGGSTLGVGCSDPYGAGLNGSQFRLGPKFEVNAFTGVYPYPHFLRGITGDAIFKRCQVKRDDMDPALNPGATYLAEGHYVTADDAQDGNGENNASWELLSVGTLGGGGYPVTLTGGTIREEPAIVGWASMVDGAELMEVRVPGEGVFHVGQLVTDNGDGTWRYEYMVFNLNSHRSGGSFTVNTGAGVTVTETTFHAPMYHSGEPYSNTPWAADVSAGSVTWATTPFAETEDADAVRWSSLYNFGFTADSGPEISGGTLGLFRPGTPDDVAMPGLKGPAGLGCVGDLTGDGAVTTADLTAFLGAFGSSTGDAAFIEAADLTGDGTISTSDLTEFLGRFGLPC